MHGVDLHRYPVENIPSDDLKEVQIVDTACKCDLGNLAAQRASIRPDTCSRYPHPLANAIFEYLEIFYNHQRRHSALNMLTPNEYENLHHQLTVA